MVSEIIGIVTRIDFHTKVKENLGKDIKPVVILGACNPSLAYEAFTENPDVTSLLPCKTVVREIESGRVSIEIEIEIAKPTAMMKMLGDQNLVDLAGDADERLQRVLKQL